MNICAVMLFIAFSICNNKCSAQNAKDSCNGMSRNQKRYEVEQGTLKYFVYSVNKNGKKNDKLVTIDIAFTKYGSLQDIKIQVQNEYGHRVLQVDPTFSTESDKLLLNYFVPDSCSFYYKGIDLIKPQYEKYKDKTCIRFIQYRFDNFKGSNHTGTVRYCDGIPVYIRGGFPNKTLIWELQ